VLVKAAACCGFLLFDETRRAQRNAEDAEKNPARSGLFFGSERRILCLWKLLCKYQFWRSTPVGASPHFSLGSFRYCITESQVIAGMAFDIEHVREIAARVAASSGLEVVEVEMRGGGKARMLRIYIDKPGGVTHEDCANLSREVGTILDVEDAIPGGSYVLEVSSPGLDRKLNRPQDYERFTGSRVKITTRDPLNGNRHFEGRLEDFRDGVLTLDVVSQRKKARPAEAPEKLRIELGNVEKANLVPEI
jgi:ribosome maturation factor RimP